MQEQEIKIKVVIIVANKKINNINLTIENLKAIGLTEKDYIIAVQYNSDEIENYCKNNHYEMYQYKDVEDIYYELPKNIDFDFISFIREGDTYTANVKEAITNYMDNHNDNILICPIMYNESNYILNKKFKRSTVVDIELDENKIWIHLNSVFFHKKILEKLDKTSHDDLTYYFENSFLTKAILLNGGYSFIRSFRIQTMMLLENCSESKIESYDLKWYYNIFHCLKELTTFSHHYYGKTLNYIYYVFLYMLKNIINENANTKNKHIIKNKEKEKFYQKIMESLKIIDDDVIMNSYGNKNINYYLLKLKYDKFDNVIQYREFVSRIHVVYRDRFISNASDIKLGILLMDYSDGYLEIVGNYPFPFDEKKLKIYVEYLGKKYYVQKNDLYQDYKIFGSKIYDSYAFEVKIPLKKKSMKNYINFYLESENATIKLDIKFSKPLARLSGIKTAYWNCGDFTLNYRQGGILVLPNKKLRHIKREIKYILYLLRKKDKYTRESGRIRIVYHLTKPFYKKTIWLFEDKIYKGGDNGEYLYTYANKQNDGIKKYYVLTKDCLDAKRFKQEHKKYIKYGSLRHKLIFLNSDIVFTTHNCTTKHHSFDETNERYFRDLFHSTNVCIQHGLTVQYIPHLTNRINDNLKKYFLASPVEMKNMLTKEYAYKNHEDILTITGCPRYDGLKNNDQKQILITPTWRNYLAMPVASVEEQRSHNNNFKKSVYFKIYNSFINNEKLIKTAKKTGYKLIYLLHPCTSPQINDFDRNEDVELIAANDDLNYEKILTESSLMVTDYSGVQFDFAYMYKPIIYFHPDELPPSYDEGEYKYDSMALGEITKTLDETIDLLCEYMENNCKIKEKYKKRIDEFFTYHDYNNCERIYKESVNIQEKLNKKGLSKKLSD